MMEVRIPSYPRKVLLSKSLHNRQKKKPVSVHTHVLFHIRQAPIQCLPCSLAVRVYFSTYCFKLSLPPTCVRTKWILQNPMSLNAHPNYMLNKRSLRHIMYKHFRLLFWIELKHQSTNISWLQTALWIVRIFSCFPKVLGHLPCSCLPNSRKFYKMLLPLSLFSEAAAWEGGMGGFGMLLRSSLFTKSKNTHGICFCRFWFSLAACLRA